jgi:hypothetical protein
MRLAGFPGFSLLGGAGLLVQTPASLTRLGVLPEHVAPRLDKIIKAA